MKRSHSIFYSIVIFLLIVIAFSKFDGNSLFSSLFSLPNSLQKQTQKQAIDDNETVLRKFHETLKQSEKKIFSQNGEDGVLMKLAEMIKKTHKGYYVEFGASNGNECNTRYLREKFDWTGLLMDGYRAHSPNPIINLRIETILHTNILELFEKYKVKPDLDLLSVDTDYADYWILEKILSSGRYKPKLVVHETNGKRACISVAKSDELHNWDGATEYSGASSCAYQCLAKRFNYTMVYCEVRGVNCFWMRDDLLVSLLNVKDANVIKSRFTPEFVYPHKLVDHSSKFDWTEIKC